MKARTLFLSLTVSFVPLAHAVQIFKCKAASGETIYQNEPCPKNSVAVAQGSYNRQPDDPTTQQAAVAEAERANTQREYETQAAAMATYGQEPQVSAYESETAARNAQVEAGSYASRIGRHGRAKTQAEVAAEALRPKRSAPQPVMATGPGITEPQRIQDQNGNFYQQPPGSAFVTDEKTGKQCFKYGDFIDCN